VAGGGDFHLAQLNVGIAKAPLDGPELADFMAALDPVNAIADASPGFVWRLQTEEGNATAIRAFGGDTIVNMSVWESLESLRAFVYSNRAHLDVMRRRREWFEKHVEAFQVLWWVPAGHVPSVPEAEGRLLLLRDRGPSPEAFTFRRHFPAPAPDAGGEAVDDDRWLCPAG
jgi:heme-degrading monooxygenase HmoA